VDGVGEARGDPGGEVLEGGEVGGADGEDQLAEGAGLGGPGFPAGEGLVHGDGEGPDVGAMVDVLGAPGLLRGHEHGGADHAAGLGELAGLGGVEVGLLGDAEVADLGDEGPRGEPVEEEVGGLDVAVDDPGGVGRREALAGLHEEAAEGGGFEGTGALDELIQVLAVEEFHDDEGEVALGVGLRVDDPDHVLAVDLAGRAGLPDEAPEPVRVPLGGEHHLEGAALLLLQVDALEDGPHAALSQEFFQAIAAPEGLPEELAGVAVEGAAGATPGLPGGPLGQRIGRSGGGLLEGRSVGGVARPRTSSAGDAMRFFKLHEPPPRCHPQARPRKRRWK
jgi:hypothetical protein